MVYGLLTEANAELGYYKDAETAAQWMLNLRPGNLPALTNAAHLRELFGDMEGSYELLQMAYESTPPTEEEERAWLLTQMGHLRLADRQYGCGGEAPTAGTDNVSELSLCHRHSGRGSYRSRSAMTRRSPCSGNATS